MSLVEFWLSEIQKDLAPFADPGTTIAVESSGGIIDAVWTQSRVEKHARFIVRGSEGLSVEFSGRDLSYRSFFASDGMANIFGIAKTTLGVLPKDVFVETRAKLGDGPEEHQSAVQLLQGLTGVRRVESENTAFLMVTGDAGAGKTSVLKELVRRQAQLFVSGQAEFVYLYVNAQGRALARFHEALATELNELRVYLPHHAVAVLVRLGLVVPVIDGFDELLGVGGYDDAFSSISSFVTELGGKGAIVASARSTYYEQEFLARSERISQQEGSGWELKTVRICGWGDIERQRYVSLVVGPDEAALEAQIAVELNKIFSGVNSELADKPLFVARTARILAAGGEIGGGGSLIERLADEFVAREQNDKLLRKDGRPILSASQIKDLCEDLAEEMWSLSTRELDRLTVKELAEQAMLDLSITPSDKNVVIERMPSMAFLQKGEAFGSVSFEHELFFDLFLASRMSRRVRNGSSGLRLMFSRASMPDSLSGSVVEKIRDSRESDGYPEFEILQRVLDGSGSRHEVVRENCGRLIGGLLVARSADGPIDGGFTLRGAVFPGTSFHGVQFVGATFIDSVFKRVDLTGTVFEGCSGTGLFFESPLLNSETKLDIDGLEVDSGVFGLRVADVEGGVRSVYEPIEVRKVLKACQLPSACVDDEPEMWAVDPSVVKIVEQFVKASTRANPVCLTDEYWTDVFEDSRWPRISRIGEAAGLMRREIRDAKGQHSRFVRRMVKSDEVLRGLVRSSAVTPSVSEFWKLMAVEFPETAAD